MQVPVGDAKFAEVRKVKAPLLVKACRRLLTDERFAGAGSETPHGKPARLAVSQQASMTIPSAASLGALRPSALTSSQRQNMSGR